MPGGGGATNSSYAAPVHSRGTDQLAGPWSCFLEEGVFVSCFYCYFCDAGVLALLFETLSWLPGAAGPARLLSGSSSRAPGSRMPGPGGSPLVRGAPFPPRRVGEGGSSEDGGTLSRSSRGGAEGWPVFSLGGVRCEGAVGGCRGAQGDAEEGSQAAP